MHELINIRTGKKTIIPSDLEELTQEQYIFYIDLALQYFNGFISDVFELKRRLFVRLADVKVSWRMFFYSIETQNSIWDSITDRINLMDSFFDIVETDNGKQYKMHMNSVLNLLPEWKGYKTYKDIFAEMNWGDFRKCCDLLKMIQLETKRGNDEESDNLVEELFFTLYKCNDNKKEKPYTPESVLFHALNYFSYIYNIITTTPIEINGEVIDFSILWNDENEEKDNSVPNKLGWNNIHFELSEKGVFGSAEQADKEKFINVFLWMYKQRLDSIAMEKKLNNKSKRNG